MTKRLTIAATLALALLPAATLAKEAEGKQVTVLGRTWTVTPAEGTPGVYTAERDNNGLNPFGQPAKLRVAQAMRAIKAATGCTANYDTMYSTISGVYTAHVICPK